MRLVYYALGRHYAVTFGVFAEGYPAMPVASCVSARLLWQPGSKDNPERPAGKLSLSRHREQGPNKASGPEIVDDGKLGAPAAQQDEPHGRHNGRRRPCSRPVAITHGEQPFPPFGRPVEVSGQSGGPGPPWFAAWIIRRD